MDQNPPDGSHVQDTPFVVVGLGASAGGLEALEAFFGGLPKTDSCAFVVVIHLDPEHESEMASVLARTVPLPVTQVTEAARLEAGHVYVIPPNKNLVMADGHLWLTPLESERRERRPIDHFFRTLAEAYGDHAVAVVLSGTGMNGTVGVRAIKEAGGLVLAQAPDDAAFDEMPRSAAASGAVDRVAPAAALAAEAIAYGDRLRTVQLPTDNPGALAHDDVRAVQRVLAQLYARTGHDFAHYKRSTVLRRLERRLHVVGAETLDEYLGILRESENEAAELVKDLLISVTNFFRDPEAFAALEKDIVPRLFDGKGPADTVRVWVAGCATGEEAYSVAILLAEHAATLDDPPSCQVFGTDLSESAIRVAREGVYPESIEADVNADRLRRWFRGTPAGYRVSELLRETVLFAPHSLLRDPPFSNVDLVTCRNVLIYFQRILQQRALDLFHYALVPGGYLFLGTSETPDVAEGAFTAVDKANRVYQRGSVRPAAVPYPPPGVLRRAAHPADRPADSEDVAPPAPFAELHRRLRAAAAPPSLLVSEDGDVVHSEGAGHFLSVGDGEPTRNVVRLVRPELRAAVQTALFQARRQTETVTAGPVRVSVDGVPLDVVVLASAAPEASLVQLLFDADPARPDEPGDGDARADGLVTELQDVREQLHLTIEEFETSREELRAQNEELQSTNEELRSTAEELETSKEEAQSITEELRSVNDELKVKVDEAVQARDDIENLVASTEIATVFLDRQLRIKAFTPPARALFHVRTSDIGRPLADLAEKFGDSRVAGDAEAVLERLQVLEREVQNETGRWYLVNVRPYRTADDRIDGVVVTFVDVTELKRIGAELEAVNASLEGRVQEGTRKVRELAARLTVAEQDERERIALVLHDDLQQHLYGLKMMLSLFQRASDPIRAVELADEMSQVLTASIETARTLAAELSPTILQTARLEDLLAWMAGEKRRKHGLEVDVEVRDDVHVRERAVRILVYQSLREVLFNVVKHSGSKRARLTAWADEDCAVVRVQDDGAGFDLKAARDGEKGGFGLFSVQERIGLVGGRFEIDSSPGQGTRVTLTVPSGESPE